MNIKMVSIVCFIVGFGISNNLWAWEYTVGLNYEQESAQCFDQESNFDHDMYEQDLLNQGGMGICYAHSVAQIYGSMYKKIYGKSVLPSPMMISLNASIFGYKSASFTYAKWSKKLLWLTPIFGWEKLILEKKMKEKKIVSLVDGGRFQKVFRDFHKFKVCSYGAVENFLSISGDQQDSAKMLELLYDYLNLFFNRKGEINNNLDNRDIAALSNLGYSLNSHVMVRLQRLQNYLFSNRNHIKKHFLSGKPYLKRTLGQFFRSLCSYDASEKIKYGKSFDVRRITGSDVSMTRVLNTQLSGANIMPVEMGYCVNHLTGKGEEGDCGYHSSVIYGRRCVRGRLQFLIRNSWGGQTLRQQHRDHSPWSQADKNSDYHKMKGDFWITQGFLKKSWTKKYGDLNLILLK